MSISGMRKGGVAAMAVFVLSLVGQQAVAGEDAQSKDLKNYVCKDVMRLSGEDREIALALLHGYELGKKGTTEFTTEKLAGITDNFLTYCLDHPNENALASFEKLAN